MSPITASLFNTLVNLGVLASDAQVLQAAYPAAGPDEFVAGLDQVTRILLNLELPGMFPPACEPWGQIHDSLRAAADIPAAYAAACAALQPVTVQQAVIGAVAVRMQSVGRQSRQQGSKPKKTIDYLNAFRALGYSFRLNLCDDTLEVDRRPMTEAERHTIRCRMADAGFSNWDFVQSAMIADAARREYHPVREYLGSLRCDGGQHIAGLAGHFQDKHAIFPALLRKWLIGSVAKVMDAEAFNPMLVLDGTQNLGKSYFARWLCPLKSYFLESAIDPDNEDHRRRLMAVWIWEVAELGGTTRRADRDALKEFISLRIVRTRKKYDRFDTVKAALSSFIGTINNEGGFLSDPTGNRRFWTCYLTGIDWRYARDVSIDQVWAEAYAAYLAGEGHDLSAEERTLMGEINEFYEIADPIAGKLEKYFRLDPGSRALWTSTTDILEILEDPDRGALKGTSKANSMMLSSAATRLGLEKAKRRSLQGRYVWGYYGVEPL